MKPPKYIKRTKKEPGRFVLKHGDRELAKHEKREVLEGHLLYEKGVTEIVWATT